MSQKVIGTILLVLGLLTFLLLREFSGAGLVLCFMGIAVFTAKEDEFND